jgi:putative PEP-CTERM system TPR-repeat lipoprotein
METTMNLAPKRLMTFFSVMIVTLVITGCGEEQSSEQPTKEEVQYLSHIDQAKFYQQQGQLKASIQEASNAINLKHDSIEPFNIIGHTFLIAGDGKSAQKQFQGILESESPKLKSNPILRNNIALALARSLFIQKKADEALITLSKLTLTDQTNQINDALLKGDINLFDKEYSKATQSYKTALALNNKSIEALIGLSKTEYLKGNTISSVKYTKDADKIEPNNSQLWLWKAQLAQQEKRWEDAELYYIRALEGIGGYDMMTLQKYSTISSLIETLRAQGKMKEAFIYDEILAKSLLGSLKNSFETAQNKYREGDLRGAALELEVLLKKTPGHPESLYMLGMIYYQLGRYEQAEKMLTTFMLESESKQASKLLAATQLKRHKPGEASALLKKLGSEDDPHVLSLVGIAALESGDKDIGLSYLEKSLSLNPTNHDLRLKVASYFNANKEHENAIKQLQKILALDENHLRAKILLMATLVKNNQFSEAETIAKRWLKQTPNDVNLLNIAGTLYLSDEQFEQAESYFNKALLIDNADINSRINLAILFQQKKQHEKSLSMYREAVTLSPENKTALLGFVRLSKELQQEKEAVEFMEQLTDKNDQAVSVRLALAEYFAKQGNLEKAVNYVLELHEIDNKFDNSKLLVNVYRIVTVKLLQAGQSEKARKILEQAKINESNALDIGLLQASMEFSENNLNKGLSILNKLKNEYPESSAPFMVEGDHFMKTKNYQRAANAYSLASSLSDTQALAIKRYNALRLGKEKGIDTKEPLESWMKDNPDSPEILTMLAMSYQSEGNHVKAIELYEKLITIRPSDSVAMNNLAWLYFEQDNPKALTLAEKAYNVNPNIAAIADTYGWILLKKGKVKDSIFILEKAHDLDKTSEEIAMHLKEARKIAH